MKKLVLMIFPALICGMVLTSCNNTNDNTELSGSELDETTLKVAFEKVPPASMPYEVKFVNSSDNGDTYFWDFGDGQTSDEREPTHTYTEAGMYCVTLALTVFEVVDDKPMQQHQMFFTDYVIVNSLPLVDASSEVFADFCVSSPCLPNEVMFINKSKNAAAACLWSFGDGFMSSQIEPIHTYTETGTYNVTLTVTGKDMSQTSITKSIVIKIDE